MNTYSTDHRLTLDQIYNMIKAVPENVVFVEGEPGVGKSSLLDRFKADPSMSNYIVAPPIDAQSMDLGDISMPVVDRERMVTNYAPNSRFMIAEAIRQNRPVVILIDELTKSPQPVQNMLQPLFEMRRRLGDLYLPEGSIVFCTGNLGGEGLGDALKAHTRNRLTVVEVSKPIAAEWIPWAVDTGVDPAVIAFVRQVPHTMASYRDGDQDENPYIFNPRKVQRSVFSPRSAVRASRYVAARDQMDAATLRSALRGCIGDAAAADLDAFIAYQDELPSRDSIIANPAGAPLPASAGANVVLVFGLLASTTSENLPAYMQYVRRLEPEWQAVFGVSLAGGSKQHMAFKCQEFTHWARENHDILG